MFLLLFFVIFSMNNDNNDNDQQQHKPSSWIYFHFYQFLFLNLHEFEYFIINALLCYFSTMLHKGYSFVIQALKECILLC